MRPGTGGHGPKTPGRSCARAAGESMLQPSPRFTGNVALESTGCSSLPPLYGSMPGTAQSLRQAPPAAGGAADHAEVMRELELALLADGGPEPKRPAALAAEHAQAALAQAMRGSGTDFYRSRAAGPGIPARVPHVNASPRRLVPFASTILSQGRVADVQKGPRFDVLTLREWFNEMDSDHSGHVTKVKWLDFLRANPSVKSIILAGSGAEQDGSGLPKAMSNESAKRTQVRQLRFLQKIWKDIDEDGNGTLEWEEFIEFFRKLGFLFQYADPNNPKDRLAEMLKDLHENAESMSEDRFDEFHHLKGKHLHAEKRRVLEVAAASDSRGFALALAVAPHALRATAVP